MTKRPLTRLDLLTLERSAMPGSGLHGIASTPIAMLPLRYESAIDHDLAPSREALHEPILGEGLPVHGD